MIQEESFCSSLQNHSDRRVQEESAYEKGNDSLGTATSPEPEKAGLKLHVIKQGLFPLVQCIYFIWLQI